MRRIITISQEVRFRQTKRPTQKVAKVVLNVDTGGKRVQTGSLYVEKFNKVCVSVCLSLYPFRQTRTSTTQIIHTASLGSNVLLQSPQG